jgi:hypothetical protein
MVDVSLLRREAQPRLEAEPTAPKPGGTTAARLHSHHRILTPRRKVQRRKMNQRQTNQTAPLSLVEAEAAAAAAVVVVVVAGPSEKRLWLR